MGNLVEIKECKVCGEEFESDSKTVEYCSHGCYVCREGQEGEDNE